MNRMVLGCFYYYQGAPKSKMASGWILQYQIPGQLSESLQTDFVHILCTFHFLQYIMKLFDCFLGSLSRAQPCLDVGTLRNRKAKNPEI